jgi:preprotein translocase subunit SecA
LVNLSIKNTRIISLWRWNYRKFRTKYYLINTDRIWREHLQKMTLLREAVGWRGYGQRNPLYEYKQDAFYMFETREELLRHLVIYDLLRSSIL